MKDSLKNMTLVMLGITLVCSAAVGGVYMQTKATIDIAAQQKLKAAYGEVLPKFDEISAQTVESDGMQLNVNTATKGDAVVGYAVESSANGFGGEFKLVAGFDATGKITGVKVLSQAETPGLGANITKPDNKIITSILGKNPSEIKFYVKKDGGDVDALTAATITSRAYVLAVQRAFNAYLQMTGAAVDSHSGASKVEHNQEAEGGKEEDHE